LAQFITTGDTRQALDVVNARAVVKCDDADVAIVYGHITGFAGKIGKHINKGTALGTVMYWPINNSHLHLGVNVFGQAYMKWPWGFGRCPKSATPEEVASHGWVDPIEYLLSNSLK